MGRYYHGNIAGKFWFGTQSSYDPENLHCQDVGHELIYKVCHCFIDYDDYDNYECNLNEYCRDCYDSKEAHWSSVITDDPYDTSDLCYEINDGLTKWIVYADDVEKIKKTLNEIDTMINVQKYITDIDYSEDENFMMDIHFTEETQHDNELLARWTLGKQILHYFETTKNDTCVFWGEN